MQIKTIVRSARHQGKTQALCEVGQDVRVTGQADGSPATSVHDGIVTRVVPGIDGRLRVTLGHGGTNPRTVTVAADEIYVTVGGRPFPNLIPTIEDSQTEEAVSRDYALHLVASAPSHGDRHVDPDATACELGSYASRDEAHRAGRAYLREHAGAWLQVSGVGSIDDVTLE